MCRAIYAEFAAAAEKLARVEYDVWDTTVQTCTEDLAHFKTQTREFDKRLAAIILQVRPCLHQPHTSVQKGWLD